LTGDLTDELFSSGPKPVTDLFNYCAPNTPFEISKFAIQVAKNVIVLLNDELYYLK